MPTNDAIDKKLEDLDIVKAIENKDVPYVIVQIKQLINAARAEATKRALDKARHFVFKIDFDYDLDEETQMQINAYMLQVVEQHSAFIEALQKQHEVD